MKTLYLELNMGASGDMLMGALLDLIDDKQAFIEQMNQLGLPGVSLKVGKSVKCGITGIKADISVHGIYEESQDYNPVHEHDHPHDQDHGHSHDHEHEHSHDHAHTHDHAHEHPHDHEHTHDHDHSHDQDHGHSHDHEHDHSHDHEHGHSHDHEHAQGHSHHHGGGLPAIRSIVDKIPVSETVKQHVIAVYQLIGEAEAKAHDKPVEEVHFHEVGTLDAVADITGVCLLMEKLAPDYVAASPVHVGSGMVRCAHGILPVPAPATAHILKDIPTYGGSVRGELCTPTGAALLKHFVNDFHGMPVMAVSRVGYGMGSKDFPAANCVRSFLGTQTTTSQVNNTSKATSGHQEKLPEITQLTCNLDDMSGEDLGYVQEILWQHHALDVFTQPIFMKKNRPATMLTCLCREQEADQLAVLMLRHTTTLGVRRSTWQRYEMKSERETVQTEYGEIKIKRSHGFGITKEKPEYDDLEKAAANNKVSLADVRKVLTGNP